MYAVSCLYKMLMLLLFKNRYICILFKISKNGQHSFEMCEIIFWEFFIEYATSLLCCVGFGKINNILHRCYCDVCIAIIVIKAS